MEGHLLFSFVISSIYSSRDDTDLIFENQTLRCSSLTLVPFPDPEKNATGHNNCQKCDASNDSNN